MTSLRKVDGLDPGDNETLREMIATRVKVDGERRQVQKDAHLIEAALEADRVVVSLDDRARRAFDKLAPHSGSLCSVSWIDRVRDRERLDAWMDGSSPAAKHWRLGELT